MQAGVRFRPNERHSFGLELYANDIEGLIEFDLATFELRNIAQTEIRGAELDWEYRVVGFTLRTALVRQSVDDVATGQRLPRRAEQSMTLQMARDFGAHRLGLSLLASGDRADLGGVRLPGYLLANLTGRFALGERWQLNARVENVLDTEYRTAANYRMQERSYFVDLRFEW
jgi:vitamin B12 transporter